MTEIAQLFESALRQNRANLLRQAAINTVAKMPPRMTLNELLHSEAGASIRRLTLQELKQALAQGQGQSQARQQIPVSRPARRKVAVQEESPESREVRLYREILDAVEQEPLTIGQLAKQVEIDVTELRGYLTWMKKMGKIGSTGRARATRYHVLAG